MKIILLLIILPYCYCSLCPKGEYWSTFSEICVKCTHCKPHQIVLRTCQLHKDTICSTIAKTFNHNKLEINNKNDKKIHHFEKGKLHFITDENAEEIIDNTINYPSLEMKVKLDSEHKHHTNNKNKEVKEKKQRINDKFLKWDDNDDDDDEEYDDDEDGYDDYDYDTTKQKVHSQHKAPKTNHHHAFNMEHHHYKFLDSEEDDGHNNLDAILNKNSKNSWHTRKWKDDIIKERKEQKNKKAERLAKLEDEKKLEEWLKQSRKQFKDRKDNLLKTLKEEQLDSFENDKRIRLNYPLFNANDRFSDSIKYNTKDSDNSKGQRKHKVESEVELFKELIKNEESQEMELATLMSNKKESPFHYKTATPAHRMFLGEPSSDLSGISVGRIKDPQEVIKEEMGRNIIYEKSKFNVVPIIKNDEGEEIVPIEFSAAERLVWDWQAVAVVSAVAACLLFFLVISIFMLANARQWRKEKHPFHAESEELSTRVALIQPSLEASAAEGNNTNRFLQQFLSLNEDVEKERIYNADIIKS